MEKEGLKMDARLSGMWITGSARTDDDDKVPPYVFQKSFSVGETEIVKATVSASALGCYAAVLNGHDISDEYFAPGYTQYTKRIFYNTYDVTSLLHRGINVLTAAVAGGWYCGRLGLVLRKNCFGRKRAFCLTLLIEYADGRREKIETDGSWKVTCDGPLRFAGFFDGEVYDAQKKDLRKARWQNARTFTGNVPPLEACEGSPVRLHRELRPIKITKDAAGSFLIDFGKNIAGIVSLHGIQGKRGQEIVIRHGEVLDQNGKLYTNNLRTAKAELRYRCADGLQSYLPRFTYMGFRYACVTGLEDLSEDQISAYELYSDMCSVGNFSCSNENLNRLQENIVTSLKANFVDIPTDCPQRDERCGWTGDIALFLPTASYNMDTSAFMKKWLHDVSLTQYRNGAVPHIVPDNGISRHLWQGIVPAVTRWGTACWGDVIVLASWQQYMETGDISFLTDNYEAMKKWLAYEEHAAARFSIGENRYIWDKSFQYGDWLAPGESLMENIKKGKWTATAYFAHSAYLLSRVAAVLGKQQDARKYRELFEHIRHAFRHVFLAPDGHLKNGFQSLYVLAVQFHLLTNEETQLAVQDLAADIRSREGHLATGFVGTPFLNFVLSDYGYADLAYEVLLKETPPGWMYQVRCGATSMWERWDALKEDGTVKDGKDADINMVSFNHYSYGSIGNWLYQRVAGIEPVTAGYRRFRVRPVPGGGLKRVQSYHDCPYGRIEIRWVIENQKFRLCVTVPEKTTACIELPDGTKYRAKGGIWNYECSCHTADQVI